MTLVVLGAGAVAVSLALDEQPRVNRVEGNLPVNEGALDLTDIKGAQLSDARAQSPQAAGVGGGQPDRQSTVLVRTSPLA